MVSISTTQLTLGWNSRSEGVPERRIFSLGALPGWVVWDSVFLVVLVLVVVRPGDAAARDPSVPSSD